MPLLSQKLLQAFQDGGPVMWPILILSLAGLTVTIERFFVFAAFFKSKEKPADPQAAFQRLQRGLGFISTVITAEPLLGILGTVTGIIQTFAAFKATDVTAPLAATAGIGEALITTAAGLIATLLLLFPYNLLLSLLAQAAARLERDHETEV